MSFRTLIRPSITCDRDPVLQLARLVVRHEQTSTTYGDAGTHVTYQVSADGRAGIERGNVAEVEARRVPD